MEPSTVSAAIRLRTGLVLIFSQVNQLTGNEVRVYRHSSDTFEVEIVDAHEEYIGGSTCYSQRDALQYALGQLGQL